jgi:hypothetical protein
VLSGAAPLVLPEPPVDLAPALRRLAVTAFDLEQRISSPSSRPLPIDDELVAFEDARLRVRDAFRAWA